MENRHKSHIYKTNHIQMKYNILALLIFFSSGIVSAQDSIVNRNVTVEREYQPLINDAGKIITNPKVLEPIVEKTKAVFSDITAPLKIGTNIQTLDPEELKHLPSVVKNGFARVGLGYPLNTLAEFMYPLVKNENNRLDLSLRHLGALTDKIHSKTTTGIQYDHLFSGFNFYTGITGRHDFYNYYGRIFGADKVYQMADITPAYGNAVYTTPEANTLTLRNLSGFPLNETNWRVNFTAGARSLPDAESLNYDISMNYNLFTAISGKLTENELMLKANFDVPFNYNRMGMNVEIHNLNYGSSAIKPNNFPLSYNLIKINPFYKLKGENWLLKLGVKTGLSLGHGQVFTPSPDVTAQWNAVPEYLSLYGGVTGDLTVNTLSRTYDENRYISPGNRLEDLYTPLDAFLGIKLSPASGLMFDVWGDYQIIHNQYLYVNRSYTTSDTTVMEDIKTVYHNRFDVIYAPAGKLSAGMRLNYDYKNRFGAYVKGAYHSWKVENQDFAWQLPVWDSDLGMYAKIKDNISLNTQFIFQDGRYARLGNTARRMNAVYDWNLGASYAYLDWLSVFIKLNNILNSKYDYYYGYQVQGINAMIGASFSF